MVTVFKDVPNTDIKRGDKIMINKFGLAKGILYKTKGIKNLLSGDAPEVTFPLDHVVPSSLDFLPTPEQIDFFSKAKQGMSRIENYEHYQAQQIRPRSGAINQQKFKTS